MEGRTLSSRAAFLKYEKTADKALAEYRQVEKSASVKYEKVTQPSFSVKFTDYKAVEKVAWAEYEKYERRPI